MNWSEIIDVAEAALKRERATMDPEIERLHSIMGKEETSIGRILVDIIESAKAEDAAKMRESLKTLRLEYAPLADEFTPFLV